MLPTFLVIGAPKSGTTSIYNQLRTHPDVFMPIKEPDFFEDDEAYRLGIDHYASFFSGWKGERMVGEASPGYLSAPAVPERLKEHLPNVRMIACLRDPVQRAYSSFRMQIFNGAESRDAAFTEAVRRVPQYLDQSRYARQLDRYYRLFPRDQLLVTWFDDLRSSPVDFYGGICRFLEIAPIDFDNVKVHASLPGREPPRALRMRLVRLLRKGFDIANVGPLRHILDRRLVRNAWHKMRNALRPRATGSVGYPPLSAEERSLVLPLIRDDVLRLQELTGRDLSAWLRAE